MILVDYSKVKINNGFWKIKQDMVKNTTVYAVYDRFKETHRFDALSCSWQEGDPYTPHVFWDSDVAKWIEGVAYILTFERNQILEGIVDQAIEEIVRNSDEHGYFNSHFLVTEREMRFKDRNRHELYCAGHLMEAAIAYYNATGKDALLKAMCRYADYIEQIFKTEDSAAFATPGHPELELALMRLYEATGEKRYAELAKHFIDKRGTNDKDKEIANWSTYAYTMDEQPLREITEPRGHAVRALYLLCGMADVAREFHDQELIAACERSYASIINKRMYITGGIGSTPLGEAITIDYHLPNRTAYSETCAAIALAMFCLRMLRLQNHAKYADTAERVMLNGVLSGISMSGKNFFYVNPLEIDLDFNNVNPATKEKEQYPITRRPEMFGCSCCPPNLVRFLSMIGGYVYGYDEDTVYINQFVDSTLQMDGITVTICTEYPLNGKLDILCETDKKYLAVRMPEWCENATVSHPYLIKNGYMVFDLSVSNQLTIEFEMPVSAIQCNQNVHENAGRIAITRGPVVYCAEAIDNCQSLRSVYLSLDEEYALGECEFLLPSITTTAFKPEESNLLYCKANSETEKMQYKLIPYYAFANREESSMLIWHLKKT